MCKIDCLSRFDAWDRVLRAVALGWHGGMGGEGRCDGGSGWGTYVHPLLIPVNVWPKPLQYYNTIQYVIQYYNTNYNKVISLQLNKLIKK